MVRLDLINNFKSEYMEDSEVKNAIFRKGIRKALEFEVMQNLELAKRTSKSLSDYMEFSGKRAPILLVPFYNEAWRIAISSGLLFILKDKAANFGEAYSMIHEINYLIDSLRFEKYDISKGVFTPLDDAKPEYGKWIPMTISGKIAKLNNLLHNIKLD